MVPEASEPLVIIGGVGAGLIVICRVAMADKLAASVTFAAKIEVPATVGVPEITPVPASVNPAGNTPPARDHT